MVYEVDLAVQEKIAGRSDRHRLQNELSKYPPDVQKRWVANPVVEYLIQNYMNRLVSGIVSPMSPQNTSNQVNAKDKVDAKDKADAGNKDDAKDKDEKSDDSDQEGGMFNLFD